MQLILIGVIFHLGFLAAASDDLPTVLIKLEDTITWCKAEAKIGQTNSWELRIISGMQIPHDLKLKTVNQTINSKFLKTLNSFEFHFIAKGFNENHSHAITDRNWIPATLSSVKDKSQDTIIVKISNHIWLEKSENLISGFQISQNLLVMVISIKDLISFTELFEKEIRVAVDLTASKSKSSSALVELTNSPTQGLSTTLCAVFLKFWNVDVNWGITSIPGANGDRRNYVSSKCYLKFEYETKYYIGTGEIKYFKREPTMKLWIQKLWCEGQTVIADADTSINTLLQNVKSYDLASRKRDYNEEPTASSAKQWMQVSFMNSSVEINPISNHVTVILVFGVEKILQYLDKSEKINVPVILDTSDQLTIMGKELVKFEDYRKSTCKKKTKYNSETTPLASTEERIEFELMDPQNDVGVNTVPVTRLSILDTIKANIGNNNVFGFPIYQYTCAKV